MGLPFMPVHGLHGTDYEKIRRDFVKVRDPYSGKEIPVVPAIRPDYCLIHGAKADRQGNLVIFGTEAHRVAALASDVVIATVEEVVDDEDFVAKRGQTFLSALHVDYVVPSPQGAHPGLCPGYYPVDEEHIKIYVNQSKTPDNFMDYINKFVTSLSEEEYRENVSGRFVESALP
ncbi:MAG: hypothetical protein D6713_09135 [Deltaproteobacteria bacterium]|nr:MAG: hypothetical protein D6713_09135 [Deltaproteobacteria bacterium]